MVCHLLLGSMKQNTSTVTYQGRPQDLGGGGPRIFFLRFGNLHVANAAHGEAMRFARGVRGHDLKKLSEFSLKMSIFCNISVVER